MYVLAALAFIFYVSKVPERYFPGETTLESKKKKKNLCVSSPDFYFSPSFCSGAAGQLNYLGSSHQLWHLLLLLMFYWWHQASAFIMAYRHSQPCPDAPQHS